MRAGRCFIFTFLLATSCALAQEVGAVSDVARKLASTARFEFSRPQSVVSLGPGAMVAGRFDCGDNGSVYAPVQGDVSGTNADPKRRDGLALIGIRPNGATRSFPWWSVPGYKAISTPQSIFVGNDHLYLLVRGTKVSEQQEKIRSSLILKFDTSGNLEDAITLDGALKTLAIGVFPSGRILLVSEDRLNHRMSLELVDEHGVFIRELRLNNDDFIERAAQLPPSRLGTSAYSPALLIGLTKLKPWKGHLLLVPLLTSGLPIVELAEDGVVSSVIPHLPGKMILESFISSNDSTYTVQLGKVFESGNPPVDTQGKLHSIGTQPSDQITEISRASGRILRQIDLGSSGVEPACEAGGVYRFFVSDSEKKLQVVSAQLR